MQLVNSSNAHFMGAGEMKCTLIFPPIIFDEDELDLCDYGQENSSEGRVSPCLAY